METLDIPGFLKIPQVERKAAWEKVGHVAIVPIATKPMTTDEWKKEKRRIKAEKFGERNAKSLAKLKEKYAGMKYDRKLKLWVKDREREDTTEHTPA